MAELQSVGWRPPMLIAHNVQIVDHRQIAELATRARAVPRKRAHLLLHEGPADLVQRLIILMQPYTCVRPHHHSRQWEMLVLLQGRGNLLIFDADARLMDRIELSPRAKSRSAYGMASSFWNVIPRCWKTNLAPTVRINLLIGRERKGMQPKLDLLSGLRMQRLGRDGRLPKGPFEPLGYILGRTKLVDQVRAEVK